MLGRALTTASVSGAVSDPLTLNNMATSMVGIGNGVGTGTNSFASRVEYPTGNGGRSIAMGDVNADTRLDLVVANSGQNEISLLLGNSTPPGTFQSAVNYPTANTPFAVVVGSFDGDAALDVSVAHNGSGMVQTRLGMATGNLGAPSSANTTGSEAYGLTFGRLGFASDPFDLVVSNSQSSNISVLRGNGNGTFMNGMNYSVGNSPRSASIGDFNDDGRQDVVVANFMSNNVSVFFGNGNGTLQTPGTSIPVTSNPHDIKVADVDGDGKLDMVAALFPSNNLQIYWGNGDGTFTVGPAPPTGRMPRALEVVDLNADGFMDILPVCEGENFVRPVMGLPGRNFMNGMDVTVPPSGSGIVVADFNGDAKLDIAMSATTGSNLSGTSVFLTN